MEGFFDRSGHRDISHTRFRLGFFNVILHISRTMELLLNAYAVIFEVNVIKGQAAVFRNSESSVQQDEVSLKVAREVMI